MEDSLNKFLKIEAMKNGLCGQWTSDWNKDKSIYELIDMYKRGLDFCIINHYPSNEFIKNNVDKDVLEKNHIYVDSEFYEGDFSDFCTVVQGESSGEFHFGKFNSTTLWIRDNSEVLVEVHGQAWIFVHVYDNAVVTIHQHGDSRISVKRHSKDASVITAGNVKYIDPYSN